MDISTLLAIVALLGAVAGGCLVSLVHSIRCATYHTRPTFED